jgi:hypothetical protein
MRAGLIVAALLSVSPAQACRLHSIWHYPWPQRCPVAVALAPRPAPHRPPSMRREDVTIPLPSLVDIDWGHEADEYAKGRLMLRAKLDRPE